MHGLHLLPLKKIIYLEQKNRRKKKKKKKKKKTFWKFFFLFFVFRLIWKPDKSNKFRQQPSKHFNWIFENFVGKRASCVDLKLKML